jgi:hypothetical protein
MDMLQMKNIDRVTVVELDGKFHLRLYNGSNFTDATITLGNALVLLADLGKALCAAIQRKGID